MTDHTVPFKKKNLMWKFHTSKSSEQIPHRSLVGICIQFSDIPSVIANYDVNNNVGSLEVIFLCNRKTMFLFYSFYIIVSKLNGAIQIQTKI